MGVFPSIKSSVCDNIAAYFLLLSYMKNSDCRKLVPLRGHASTSNEHLTIQRSRLMMLGFAVCFIALAARALWVQVIASDFYIRQGQKRIERIVRLEPRRGDVVDRNGKPLALNVVAAQVWADPGEQPASTSTSQLQQLADLLKQDASTLNTKFKQHGRFEVLANNATPAQAEQVEALNIPGVHIDFHWKRIYLEDDLAQVVGFVDSNGVGQEGTELEGEAVLTGARGWRRVVTDRMGREIEQLDVAAARDGHTICLSVDSRIQNVAFQALQQAVREQHAHDGAAIVMDARTGELLAVANWPVFNPNDRASYTAGAMRNTAVADVFEPGSSIKPVMVALALDKGVVRSNSIIDTSGGVMRIGHDVIHDTSDHGRLSVLEVLEKSSNVGMARIALKTSSRDMAEFYDSVGLGRKPDLPLPGVATGRLRSWRHWRPIEQATMAYGYGLSTSLLQLAQAYTVFANDGRFVPATLTCRPALSPRARVIKSATARAIRRALEMAVGPGGTARKAAVAQYRVGGKTGTARKQQGHGYATGKYRTTFVGMAPMSDPRIIVAVMVDEPGGHSIYAGAVAAPIFSSIVGSSLRLLQVPPDAVIRH